MSFLSFLSLNQMMPDDDKVVSGTKNPVKNVNVAI